MVERSGEMEIISVVSLAASLGTNELKKSKGEGEERGGGDNEGSVRVGGRVD